MPPHATSGIHTYADRGSLFGHMLNLFPPSDIGSHRAGGGGPCRLEQSQTLIPGGVGAAAASMVAPQAAGWMYEAGKGLLQLYCVGWSTFATSFGCAGMLFWWAPWHGGVAGIRQDRH